MTIRMKERIRELNTERADLIGPDPPQVRVGINPVFCTVGNFGSENRLEHTIVGGVVNAAARLEEGAEPDQIQVSHAAYALIKGDFHCRPIGDVNMKWISHQLRTYEVVGEFKDLGPEVSIEAEIGDFKMSIDPSSLDADAPARARQALESALADLESGDKSDPD